MVECSYQFIGEDNLEFKKHYPNTTVKCFKGKSHCENALFHPEIMIEELDKIFDKQRYEFEFGGGLDDENRKQYVGSNRY